MPDPHTFKSPNLAVDLVVHTIIRPPDLTAFEGWREQYPDKRGPAPTKCGGHVLMIGRKNPPYRMDDGFYCLPGGFVDYGESCPMAAARELGEETNLLDHTEGTEVAAWAGKVHEIGTYSAPDRDPRRHVVSVAYYVALSAQDARRAYGGDDAAWCQWVPTADIVEGKVKVGFDHRDIITRAVAASI